ncbi:hypothetical protein N2152v2_008946 [Parachlorella kessleri]
MGVGLGLRLLLVWVLGAVGCLGNFQDGDFIPTARKGQFHGVAVPIPQPIDFEAADDYKIQFSFDGERLLTPWLLIIGKWAQQPPYVEVDLLRSGDQLKSVGAQVKQLPEEDQRRHAELVAEFANSTHWPKHLLVYYRWQVQHEVDQERGLTLLFAAGVVSSLLLGLNVVRSYKKHLGQFIADFTGDAMGAGGGAPAGPKAE